LEEQMTAIILAGGKSSRTTKYKAFMEVGEVKIITRMITELKKVFKEIIVIADKEERYKEYDLKVFIDLIPEKGPLVGLYTGLLNSKSNYNFVVGCDQPFLEANLIKYLINQADEIDIVAFQIKGKLQFLGAIYNKSCLPLVEKSIKEGIYSFKRLYELAKVRSIAEEEISSLSDLDKAFLNVNTDMDLLKAERYLNISAIKAIKKKLLDS